MIVDQTFVAVKKILLGWPSDYEIQRELFPNSAYRVDRDRAGNDLAPDRNLIIPLKS